MQLSLKSVMFIELIFIFRQMWREAYINTCGHGNLQKYTGKAISDKTLIRLKFGSKPFVDNELYKIHCNLSYLGGIPSQYIYMCMQQKSVRSRRNCPPYLKKC